MSNPQLAEIDASLQAIVRRAYELGRGDALKKVVDALNSEQACGEQLALMGPETAPDSGPQTQPSFGPDGGSSTPWWAWPVR